MIALYAIAESGLLTPIELYHHRQATPRDIWFSGDLMVTTDEDSHCLTLLTAKQDFAIHQLETIATGAAKPTCMIEVR